jgi:hypothetical protein
MEVVVITKGAHARNVHMPHPSEGPFQYAHRWDPDEQEDCPHQAHNFLTYAHALGGYTPPMIVLADRREDPNDQAEQNCHLADFASIVGTALDTEVEIR